jgi:hypothetical protein
VAKAITFQQKSSIIYVEHNRLQKKKPYIMDMSDQAHGKTYIKSKEKRTKWDFLSTFVPPEELSIENGNIWKIERLLESSPDYEHVAKMFLDTFNGIKVHNQPRIGVAPKKIKRPMGSMVNPPMMPGPFGNPLAGRAMMIGPGGPMGGRVPIIKKIEKIYNCVIYEKFINEFKRMLRKYPQKNINDLMKHLFHGTR